MASFEELNNQLIEFGQEHLLVLASDSSCGISLDNPLIKQISDLNLREVLENYNAAQKFPLSSISDPYEPVREVLSLDSIADGSKEKLRKAAFNAIAAGEVAAVIMSGGQGTRLGFSGPKGMYSIGMPSGKSIFQLHVEKIARVKSLVSQHAQTSFSIPIYVMTSDLNHSIIQDYFRENNYFGYSEKDVIFFQQGLVPSFDFDGKIIVESATTLSLSPDGNGGIYRALQKAGCMEHMKSHGVKHLHIYGIDNVLTRSLDPLFLGACIDGGVQCGNKVVWRAHKAEKVGVTAQLNGKMHILEYSEIPPHLAEESDATTQKLLFGAANICNHYLNVAFLDEAVLPNLAATYHIAKKKIPYWDANTRTTVTPAEPNGNKIEMFIFDVFPMADKWLVFEGKREDDFAPVKNAPGSAQDSPDTARMLLSQQAQRWLAAAGANIISSLSSSSDAASSNATAVSATKVDSAQEMDAPLCEISPLLSYEGENLERFAGREIILPCYLS